jgi:hypothetical protein
MVRMLSSKAAPPEIVLPASCASAFLHGAGPQPPDQLLREQGGDHNQRNNHGHETGRDHANVLQLVPHELLNAERQSPLLLIRDEHHGL